MRREIGLLLIVALAGSAAVLAKRAGPSRESLVPILRAGQDHGRRLDRLAAGALPLSADEERRIGAAVAGRLSAEPGARQAELLEIGRRLERTGLVPRFAGRYEYRTLAVPWPEAFSVPGGYVFVTDGMLQLVDNDSSRIAFILGHELGHEELGHCANLVRYRDWLSRWGVPGGGLLQAMRELAALSYSEGQELEADAFAVNLLKIADFRLEAATETIERLSRTEPPGTSGHRDPANILIEGLADYWRTHPGRQERLDRLRAAINSRSATATVRPPSGIWLRAGRSWADSCALESSSKSGNSFPGLPTPNPSL